MKVEFYLRFRTRFGQTLSITGNIPALGSSDTSGALPMQFLNEDFWYASVETENETATLHYQYLFTNEHGEVIKDAEKDRIVELRKGCPGLVLVDTWNSESYYENAFYTAQFLDDNTGYVTASPELQRMDSTSRNYSAALTRAESMSTDSVKHMQKSNRADSYKVRTKKQ